MQTTELERIISRLRTIKRHIELCECDPLLAEDYEECLQDLKVKYGQKLNELLFDIYDEYCEDNQIQPLMDYLSEQGVWVEADDMPGAAARLRLKTSPVRFEFESADHSYKKVINIESDKVPALVS